jgi:hypothetical protein
MKVLACGDEIKKRQMIGGMFCYIEKISHDIDFVSV